MRRFELDTPEAVKIDYQLAGIGTRFLAAAVDTVVELGIAGIVALGAVALAHLYPAAKTVAIIIVFASYFALIWGYFTLFETLWNGQTPGKLALHIRVMKRNGYSISFLDAVVRNLVRYVDWLPTLYGLGVVVMFISRESRRLGDYAAGTVVVREQTVLDLWAITEAAQTPAQVGLSVPAGALQAEELEWDVGVLAPEDVTLVQQFLDRAPSLPLEKREMLANEISNAVGRRIGATPPSDRLGFLHRVVWLRDHPN